MAVDDLGKCVPYLKADATKAAYWQERLGNKTKLRVGLVWSGSRTHQRNPLRAIDIKSYATAYGPIACVEFHNLQIQASEEVAQARHAGIELIDYSDELGSFDDTAAYISQLDLVITVCTSVAAPCGESRCTNLGVARRQPPPVGYGF